MAVVIRLSRGGAKKSPYYRIVVADKSRARDGRFIERLGTYNPLLEKGDAKRVVLDLERIKHWIGHGAVPSDRVARFLHEAGAGEKPKIFDQPKKSAPRPKTVERVKAQQEAAAKAAEAPSGGEAS